MRHALRWLLAMPPGLSLGEARAYRVRSVLPVIGALMHLVQAVVFFGLGLPWLASTSIVSIGLFTLAILLVRRGHDVAGISVAFAEVAAHVTFFTWVFGADAGYLWYFVVLATSPFLVFGRREKRILVGFTALPLLLAVVLAYHQWPPHLAVSASTVTFLWRLNILGAVMGQILQVAWFAGVMWRTEDLAERERARAEELLLNVLPGPVAERLKRDPGVIAESHPEATVLFADLVGFTELSQRISSEDLLKLLNDVFSAFDALADAHGIEKIKTIGDAYMAVGGLPKPRTGHAGAMAELALAMREACAARDLRVRIGIHTGPVVAGVIGRRKFAYDLWGDTVNTASRMESHGLPGQIHVTEDVRAQLDGRYRFEDRGLIAVKGKGEMHTWFLVGRLADAREIG